MVLGVRERGPEKPAWTRDSLEPLASAGTSLWQDHPEGVLGSFPFLASATCILASGESFLVRFEQGRAESPVPAAYAVRTSPIKP